MIEWISIVLAVLGPGVGLFAVWWQHKAQTMQHIRTKGAELISLGDQSAGARDNTPGAYGELLRSQYKGRVGEMESILGYLELSAPKRISDSAKTFIASTDKVGLTYMGGANPAQALAEYKQARECLVKELRK